MKKVLFSLLMAIAFMPVAFGQSNASRQFVTIDTTVCGQYSWIDGNVYTTDTTAMYVTDETIYVLNLTMLPPAVDTTNAIPVSGACTATWNGKTWATAGTFIDTVVVPGQCDSIVKIEVTLTGHDSISINETVCGYYVAPWGDTLRSSISAVDSVISTANCGYVATINLTVNPIHYGETETVTAGCSYLWRGQTITDTEVHYDTVSVAGQCDSIFSIQVTSFSHNEFDTVQIASCGPYYDADRHDTIRESGTFTLDTLIDGCTFHHTKQYTIVPNYTDTANVTVEDIVGGCTYTWHGTTYTSDDINQVFYANEPTVIGGCDSLVAIRITSFSGTEDIYDTISQCGYYLVRIGDTIWTPTTRLDSVITDACVSYRHTFLDIHDNVSPVNTEACAVYAFPYHRFVSGRTTVTDTAKFYESGSYTSFNGDTLMRYNKYTGCTTYYPINVTVHKRDTLMREAVVDTAVCYRLRYRFDNTWKNLTVSADTIFYSPHLDPSECYDSAAHYIVVVHDTTFVDDTVTTCDTYTWDFNQTTYTASTTVIQRLTDTTDANGCAIAGRLLLTINYSPDVHIEGNWMLREGETAHLKAVYNPADNLTFKWYKNNSNTPFSTADSVDIAESDNTDIKLTSTTPKGCETSNWITVTYNVGIDETESVQVNLYPNPASRYLNVESTEGLGQVVIFNALGQQVLSQEVNGTRTQLDLGSLATGTYSMRITAKNGEQTTRKFIVNK